MPDTGADTKTPADPVTLLGFDFGERRIGVAVGSPLTGRAQSLATLSNRIDGPDWAAIGDLVDQWSPNRLIVGMPYNMDGTEHRLAPRVRSFADALQARTRLPVDLVDERLSSHEALERLKAARQGGLRRRISKEDVDSAAAAIIIETWLNSKYPDQTT